MAQLGLVQNLVIRWHHLHCLQSWPPGCVTCIATLPWITLLTLSVGQLSLQKVSHGRTSGPKDRTPGLPGSDENTWTNERALVTQYFDSAPPTGGSSLHVEILSVRNHFNISNLRSFDKKKIYLQYRQVHVNVPCPGKHEKLFPN